MIGSFYVYKFITSSPQSLCQSKGIINKIIWKIIIIF